MAKHERLDPAAVQRDLERFAAAVKESEKADKAAREKDRRDRDERQQRDQAAQAHGRELADARSALEAAVEAVRRANRLGKGRAEADAAWKVAKARVIELETGSAPAWAPTKPVVADEPAAEADPAAETAEDE